MMHEVGWQEGVIQSISNFMFQNRHQVYTTDWMSIWKIGLDVHLENRGEAFLCAS